MRLVTIIHITVLLAAVCCTNAAAQQLWLDGQQPQQSIGNQPTHIAQHTPTTNGPQSEVQPASFDEPVANERRAIESVPQVARERGADAVLTLPPPSDGTARSEASKSKAGGGNALFTVVSSLAIVLGLFFVVVWLSRRALPQVAGGMPSDVVELLGRTSLANRLTLQLVRVGEKLLLVCVTPGGANTLTEISDPLEVERLTTLCTGQPRENKATSFRDVLMQVGTSGNSRPRTSTA